MEIVQASESDTGLYKCVARFRSLTFESRQAYVKVADRKTSVTPTSTPTTRPTTSSLDSSSAGIITRPPPKFYLAPEDRHAQLDDEVIFDCLALNDASIQIVSSSPSSPDQQMNAPNANVSGELLFFRYKWLKDGIPLDLR